MAETAYDRRPVSTPQHPRRRQAWWRGRAFRIAFPVAIAICLVAVWELWVHVGSVSPLILPSPLDVLARMGDMADSLLPAAGTTVKTMLIGFAIAVGVGIAAGVLIVAFRPVDLTLTPVLVASQVVPKIAVAPIIFIWFGLGGTSRLILVVLLAFFPVVIGTIAGLKSVSPNTLHLARSLGAGPVATFVRFRFPHALPEIFGGLKLAATRAVGATIIAEFLTPGPGLGRTIFLSTSELHPDIALAGIGYLVVIGVVFFFALAGLERIALPWHASVRGSSRNGA